MTKTISPKYVGQLLPTIKPNCVMLAPYVKIPIGSNLILQFTMVKIAQKQLTQTMQQHTVCIRLATSVLNQA